MPFFSGSLLWARYPFHSPEENKFILLFFRHRGKIRSKNLETLWLHNCYSFVDVWMTSYRPNIFPGKVLIEGNEKTDTVWHWYFARICEITAKWRERENLREKCQIISYGQSHVSNENVLFCSVIKQQIILPQINSHFFFRSFSLALSCSRKRYCFLEQMYTCISFRLNFSLKFYLATAVRWFSMFPYAGEERKMPCRVTERWDSWNQAEYLPNAN